MIRSTMYLPVADIFLQLMYNSEKWWRMIVARNDGSRFLGEDRKPKQIARWALRYIVLSRPS